MISITKKCDGLAMLIPIASIIYLEEQQDYSSTPYTILGVQGLELWHKTYDPLIPHTTYSGVVETIEVLNEYSKLKFLLNGQLGENNE